MIMRNRTTPQNGSTTGVWVRPTNLSDRPVTLPARIFSGLVAGVGVGALVMGFITGAVAGHGAAQDAAQKGPQSTPTVQTTPVAQPLESDGTPLMRGPNAQEVAQYVYMQERNTQCVLQWHPADTGYYITVC